MEPRPSVPAPGGAHAPRARFKVVDAVWVFLAGLVGGVLAGTLGYALSGDPADDAGALTLAFSFGGQYGGMAIAITLLSRRRGTGNPFADLGIVVRLRDWWAVPLGAACTAVFGLLVAPLVELVDENQSVVDDLLDASGPELAVFALAAGLLAPLFEEITFRGVLLGALQPRMRAGAAVAIAAVAFGLVHFLGGNPAGTAAVLPALIGVGAVAGVLAVRSGELSQPILLHVGFNAVAVLGALVDR